MRIPPLGTINSRDGTLTKSPFIRNGYIVKDGDKQYVAKRPGLRLYDALGAAAGRGLITYIDPTTKEETLFPITGTSIYQSVDSISTDIEAQSSYGSNELYSVWLAGQDGDANLDYRVQSAHIVNFGGYQWFVNGYQSRAGYGTPGQYGQDLASDQCNRQYTYYSTDNGKNWNAVYDVASGSSSYPSSRNACTIVYNNKLWVLGGVDPTTPYNRDVWSSSDGLSWTQVTSAVSNWTSGRTVLRACVHNNKMYALVGTFNSADASAYDGVCHSTDGITWTFTSNKPWTETTLDSNSSLGCMFSCSGNLIITQIPKYGTPHRYAYSADDGDTWTRANHTTSMLYSSATQTGIVNNWKAGGTVWVVYISTTPGTGYAHTIAYTNDGITYTTVTTTALDTSTYDFTRWWNKPRASSGYLEPISPACMTDEGPIWQTVQAGAWDHTPPIDGNYRYDRPIELGRLANTPFSVSVGTVAGAKFDAQQVYDLTSMMIKSNNAGYVLDTVNFTLSQITDADYPPQTVRGLVYLNGIFYVMDPDGTIWGSAEDDPTTWTATNYVSAEFEPDGGVAIAKLDSYLVAFGNYTTEQFWDAGNATGSTLSPVTSTPLLVGCANGDSVQEVEGALIWIAQAKSSGQGYLAGKFVAQLQGNNLTRVSTASIDKILEADGLSDVDSCVVAKGGQTFYLLTLHTAGVSLAYHVQGKQWYPWTQQTIGTDVSVSSITRSQDTATVTTGSAHGYSTGDLVEISGANQTQYNGVFPITVTSTTVFTFLCDSSATSPATGTILVQKPTAGVFTPAFSCNFQGMQLVLGAADGNVYEFDSDTYRDNSEFVDFRVKTDRWDGGNQQRPGRNDNKFMSSLEVIGDIQSSGSVHLRWTDDDFNNYSNWRRVDPTLERAITWRLGTFRRRSLEMLHTDNNFYRLEAFEADVESEA